MPAIRINHNVDGDVGGGRLISLKTNASADQLWSHWQYLCRLVDTIDARMTETGRRWKKTIDPATKAELWWAYEAQAREFRVLTSWKDVFYAAFVFSTDGSGCAGLDDSPAPY